MRTWTPRDVERWLRHNLAWPAVLIFSLLAMTTTIAHMAAAGPIVMPSAEPLQAGAAAEMAFLGPAPVVAATAAYVQDGESGAVLYALNADDQRAMASCTKVMTALVAVRNGALDQVITAGRDAAALVNQDNSYMGLGTGERLTLRDLLYGLLLPSGNDAAVAIADAIGGSQPGFVAMMNQQAQSLGLTHTHFANPHGLDAQGHYTSARDLAVLSAIALHDPTIAEIAATLHYIIPQTATHKSYYLTNYNSLLPGAHSPYAGAVGLKPGNTGDAGWCEAFAARRDGRLIVGVVLGDPSWSQRNVDMHALLNWGFTQEGIPSAG